jgi:hypothetical protein
MFWVAADVKTATDQNTDHNIYNNKVNCSSHYSHQFTNGVEMIWRASFVRWLHHIFVVRSFAPLLPPSVHVVLGCCVVLLYTSFLLVRSSLINGVVDVAQIEMACCAQWSIGLCSSP